MQPRRTRRFLTVLAVMVAGTTTGLWLIFQSRPPAEKNLVENTAIQPGAGPVSAPVQPPSPQLSAPSTVYGAFAPSDLLLKAPAGSFAAKVAFDAVAAFLAQSPEAQAELSRLAASSDSAKRIFSPAAPNLRRHACDDYCTARCSDPLWGSRALNIRRVP